MRRSSLTTHTDSQGRERRIYKDGSRLNVLAGEEQSEGLLHAGVRKTNVIFFFV